MFELYIGKMNTTPHHSAAPILVSSAAHAVIVATVAAVSLLVVSEGLPQLPAMMAFVADVPAPPPPPPPPPPPAVQKKPTPSEPRQVAAAPDAAPIDVPPRAELQPAADAGGEDGVEGGVEGGVPGGVLAGIVGGLPNDLPLTPPPPAPPKPRTPIRVGGQVQTPALVRRVEPEYPWIAVERKIEGVVILEATVDQEGRIVAVRALRAPSPVLTDAALRAVRQWQYTPLLLNGIREEFVVTVTLSFSLTG